MKFKKIVKEAKKPMKKLQRKQQWWFDIPGAKYYYHGDWSDPEVVYKGFSINYWDIQEGLYEIWKEENPDGDEKDFDKWFEQQGGAGGVIEEELDNCVYACLGDDGVDWDKEWLGIPDAYKVKEVSGQGDGDFVLYKDCLVDISEFEYYDEEYDNWYPYADNPEKFEAYYGIPDNKTELVTRLKESIMMYRDKSRMDEGWIGDKMKAGWEKVKTGAKKFGKYIGDKLNGPFRKGDHIVMKGEDGEQFKGTITDYSMGDNTYEVMLGKPVNEVFDSEYDGEDEEWIAGVPDLGDAVYFQGCRIPKQDIYMELHDCGVDCYDDAEFDEYCKSNQKKVYGLLSDMCHAYPVNEGLEEDVLGMPDRADELEAEIEKLWDELGDIGGKNEIVLDLISNYVELEKIEPGRVDF